ncbi:probable inorganic phosphate transporter 1-9 isoform X1 [Pistacia vera]|uniref:probable inorganic phosphate transporter 1-9 isoform X1 n=1 Tax=Pistacia vera TaxID=55513 RepID=UPI0012630F53|nr:probable inorganic phosphate transporter 1-9 isoform X1 [Pistacia vera]
MALKVLSALDTAKTQYYHFKAIIIAGMGLFTDAYDLFCIPPILILISRIYYDEKKTINIPKHVMTIIIGTALLGTVIGQLIFGRMGDLIGRRRVYGLALMLMVMSSIGCGFSVCTSRECVIGSLVFFRFLLGVGIGGDYPLSATIMSEFANKRTRGAFIAAVFSMQGFGILASSIVTVVVCQIFKEASHASKSAPAPSNATVALAPSNSSVDLAGADIAWRLILMLGSIPAALTYYWRMLMPETARYTALVEQNALQAAKDMEKVLQVSMSQITEEVPLEPRPPSYPLLSKKFLRHHGRDLFASSTSWFLLDIVFYSSNLFQSKIYHKYVDEFTNPYDEVIRVAMVQAIIGVCATIPGYYVTVYLIDRIGRVRIQFLGFFFMAIVYLAIGIPYQYHWYKEADFWFMFLYGLTFFFANFGPNTTTFIVPAELFPARFRSTCHGISGAIGKVGALIGTVGLLWVIEEDDDGYPKPEGMTKALITMGGVCFLGMAVTYFFTRETMGRSLEENENEDESSEICFFRCLTGSCIQRTNSSPSEVAAA